MTHTVFLSGSRRISRFNTDIYARLTKITDQKFHILVGDANGADKAFQRYLAENKYNKVIVYCAGKVCRNNIGGWEEKNIESNKRLTGRDFYAVKDKAMAADADYGFVVWDGKSSGSINNVLEMIKNSKPIVIYFAPERSFHSIKGVSDVYQLMAQCDAHDFEEMDNKIHFTKRMQELDLVTQETLAV